MIADTRILKDLVLVGGGHANIQVLKNFAMDPVHEVRVTLISDVVSAPYSGMLPGHMMGWYNFDDAHFDLYQICERAGARFIHGEVTSIDHRHKRLSFKARPPLDYDLLSVNVGIQPQPWYPANEKPHSAVKTPNTLPNLVALKPIGQLLKSWASFCERLKGPLNVAVVGGGAGGVEVAIAIAMEIEKKGVGGKVTLICRGDGALTTQSKGARQRIEASLEANGVVIVRRQEAQSFDGKTLQLSSKTLPMDFVFRATSAVAPTWFCETSFSSILENGYLPVDRHLRIHGSESAFAAGDCISFDGAMLPKAGVFAVRQGPILAENLRRQLQEKPLVSYRPQKKTLFIITTGRKKALASYGPFSWESSWMWTWKDRIDRQFMEKFRDFPKGTMAEAPSGVSLNTDGLPLNTCGGCGAKVPSSILRRVLKRLKDSWPSHVTKDFAGDDAGEFSVPSGETGLHSVDGFRSFISDPFRFGLIATEHALNDVYAMGGRPLSLKASVQVEAAGESVMEREIYQLMSGVIAGCATASASLAGGHTALGAECVLGLSVLGSAENPIPKRVARGDSKLILTKPLGTGALLAAHMHGAARGDWVEACLLSMEKSHFEAVATLLKFQCHSLTDITGFGLMGHLMEMFPSDSLFCGKILSHQLPVLEGAQECLQRGYSSALSKSLRDHAQGAFDGPAPEIAFDPQTSGGLLAVIPKASAEDCVLELRQLGFAQAEIIGSVSKRESSSPVTFSSRTPR